MIFSTKQLHLIILCTFSGFGEMGGHPLSSLIKPVKFTFSYKLTMSTMNFYPIPTFAIWELYPPAPMLAHVCSSSIINSWHNTWNHTTIINILHERLHVTLEIDSSTRLDFGLEYSRVQTRVIAAALTISRHCTVFTRATLC